MLNLSLLKEKILERSNDEVSLEVRRDDDNDLFFVGTIKSEIYSSSMIYIGFRITANGYVDIRFNFEEYVEPNFDNLTKVNSFNAENYSFLNLYIVSDPSDPSLSPFLELRAQALDIENEEAVINIFVFCLKELGQEHIHDYLAGMLYF